MVREPRASSSHLAILFRLRVIVLSMCQQNWGPVRDVGEAISLPLTHVFRTLILRVSVEVGKASCVRVLRGSPEAPWPALTPAQVPESLAHVPEA